MTWKERFLQLHKYGRYYWCRLHLQKKSLEKFWNKKIRRISWFVCSKQYIIAHVFEIFRNMCLEIYEFDTAPFLTATGLVWQAAFKKDWSRIRSFNWYWFVIMVEKSISGWTCHAIHWHAKADNKYMKDCDKKKNHYILNIRM